MANTILQHSQSSIEEMVFRIIQTKNLQRQEYFDLVTLFLSDFLITPEERNQINLVFDHLYKGKIKFLD